MVAEVRVLDESRSRFDRIRFRCLSGGEGCGIWYSVTAQWDETPRAAGMRAAREHADRHAR
jgi:hypothetical protein